MEEIRTTVTNIDEKVTNIDDKVTKLSITLNSMIARLEVFEKMYTSNNIASKRSIKLLPTNISSVQDNNDDNISVSSSGSKKNTVNNTISNESDERIVNALTFFKKIIMFKNYNNLRTKYSTLEMINNAKNGVKKPEGSEPYWTSIGNSIWKLLDKDQKKEIKDEFNKWKKIHQTNIDSSQLNEDNEDNDS